MHMMCTCGKRGGSKMGQPKPKSRTTVEQEGARAQKKEGMSNTFGIATFQWGGCSGRQIVPADCV